MGICLYDGDNWYFTATFVHFLGWSEVKDETLFRYTHVEILTQMVVICLATRYQLDHGGAPICL